jgi:pimeloyl-ACP methyl ester carboxylesterase
MEILVTAADGTQLIARRTGQGVPVVLVHGSAGGLGSWDPVTPLLGDEFELWVYARRGYAPSGSCRRPKTYADDVADLQAVLTAAGGSAHLVGASYGGTVALHAARAHQAAIRSVALFEPPLFAAGPELAAALGRFRDLLNAGDVVSATRLFAEKVSRVPASIIAALAGAGTGPQDAAQQAAATAEAIGCLHDLEAMAADAPDVQRWAGIDVPVLLMQGSDTWAPMPATMEALAGVLPGVTRAVFAGQSHFATHTAPGMVAETLYRFLNDSEGRREWAVNSCRDGNERMGGA